MGRPRKRRREIESNESTEPLANIHEASLELPDLGLVTPPSFQEPDTFNDGLSNLNGITPYPDFNIPNAHGDLSITAVE